MAIRCKLEKSKDIGAFAKITNKYCILSTGAYDTFYLTLDREVAVHIPIIKCSIAGTKVVGCTVTGNSKGLLLPYSVTNEELKSISNTMPEDVKVKVLDNDKISAIGNCIACNDRYALINPEIDNETEETISDILGVECLRTKIAGSPLVGTYIAMNNKGGLVHPLTSEEDLEKLTNFLEIPLRKGTVNGGKDAIASGVLVNDWILFCGEDTTSHEMSIIESVFGIGASKQSDDSGSFRTDMIKDLE